jgi:hypothetical protein
VATPVQASLEKKKEAGMGTVLAGLVIWFLRTGRKPQEQ